MDGTKSLGQTETGKFVCDLIFQEDDVTWQSVIYDLAREGKIDPWDIDIAVLSAEYLQVLKKLKEMNFRLSGKVILAAAVLLKMKAERIGLEQLLMLTNPEQFAAEGEEFGDDDEFAGEKHFTKTSLQSKIPLPRKRKVTIFELVEALKKAVEVNERRHQRWLELRTPARPRVEIKKIDIFAKIEAVFGKLKELVRRFKKITIAFEEVLPSKEKRDVIWTLLPLLHLANQGKIELWQDTPFGKILIKTSEKEFGKTLTREEYERGENKEQDETEENRAKTRKRAKHK